MKNGAKKKISPISLDLGASSTGAYFAHYEAGSTLDVFGEKGTKEGKVYTLDKNSYTYLMANRTASRHQRRGYDRRQMAKRLFRLIWCEKLGLPWDEKISQSVGFLINRRGFSFLTEDYNETILSEFPQAAYDQLPESLKNDVERNGENYDLAGAIRGWTREGGERVEKMYKDMHKEPKRIKDELFYIGRTKKLKEYCEIRVAGETITKEKKPLLSKLSKWVIEKWQGCGVEKLDSLDKSKGQVDMVKYLNECSRETAEAILKSIPPYEDEKALKDSCWYFNGDFRLDSLDGLVDGDSNNKTDNAKMVNLHLHHLYFALGEINKELASGGRHRSKYFDEIKEVLSAGQKDKPPHKHIYLKEFCEKLHKGSFKDLNVDTLTNFIGHISNLELKPLRKYFNDRAYERGDKWEEDKMAKFFGRWIIREWRVDKEGRKKGRSYAELKEKWEGCNGAVVDFWFNTDPKLTIPPYQDNNNRRPPKCQSLVLNTKFLDDNYKDWQQWLCQLQEIESVKKYLDNYYQELKNLRSGKDKLYFSDEVVAEVNKEGNLKTARELKAGSQQRRNMRELDARVLQFIFDRTKANDLLNLNEIYSQAKKIKQNKRDGENFNEAEAKLKNALDESKLPPKLKSSMNNSDGGVFSMGSFLHLVCRYYKQRQRAKDGRIFIHPEYHSVEGRGYENTGRFDDKRHLLTYCNHKPRQKRYQMFYDVAGIIQVSPAQLKRVIGGEETAQAHDFQRVAGDAQLKRVISDEETRCLEEWLEQVGISKYICNNVAKEQKDRRGKLKLDIQEEYRAKKGSLYKLCEKAKGIYLKIVAQSSGDARREELEKSLDRNPAAAFYLLAQLNNVVYKERNGNAQTCAVCSTDNAQRMQIKNTARAGRLPAIPTRIIDGAVTRMARIVGGAIAEDKWRTIEPELKKGYKVCIPIITESNQFEFEPSKEEIVKGQRLLKRKGEALKIGGEIEIFQPKDSRIKKASKGMCPYCGTTLSGNGEIDHIIPRAHGKHGTLNDEANLIYVCINCNRLKGDSIYSLQNLAPKYKLAIFGEENDKEIERKIKEQIGDGATEEFKFGKYLSFTNLNEEYQEFFRHALFMVNTDIQKQVIKSIDNRNRALVNGTQRYFAEVLANKIYKMALAEAKKERQPSERYINLLSFDYFGVRPFGDEDSVKSIRDKLARSHSELRKYAKYKEEETNKGTKIVKHPQEQYSHLIDAQIAFMLTLSQHYKDGSLKIKEQKINLFAKNEAEKDLYSKIKIDENQFKQSQHGGDTLNRKKTDKDFFSHRIFFDSEARAWHFLNLIEIQVDDKKHYLKGFWNLGRFKECMEDEDWPSRIDSAYGMYDGGKFIPYAGSLKRPQDITQISDLYSIGNGEYQFGYQRNGKEKDYPKLLVEAQQIAGKIVTVHIHKIDKVKVAEFILSKFNTKTNSTQWAEEDKKIYKQLEKLWYFTKRYRIDDNLVYSPSKLKMAGFCDPSLENVWQDIDKKWKHYPKNEEEQESVEKFLKGYFKVKNDIKKHGKARKVFSLPVRSDGQGFMLIRRNSWNNKLIYQCQSEKSGYEGVGLYKTMQDDSGTSNVLNFPFRSHNIALLKEIKKVSEHLQPLESLKPIDESKWYPVPFILEDIESIENQYQSAGDSNYRIIFKESVTISGLIKLMFYGYHIDDMKVGKGKMEDTKSEKYGLYQSAISYFQESDNPLSIEDAKKKLQSEIEEIKKIEKLTEEKKRLKHFCQKWQEALGSIQEGDRTLLYKRGVGLVIGHQ